MLLVLLPGFLKNRVNRHLNGTPELMRKQMITVSWSTKNLMIFAFLGCLKVQRWAISTTGSRTNKETISLWKDSVSELIKRTKPTSLLIYGPKNDFNFGGIKVKFFENEIIKHLEKVTKINREKKREERKAKEATKKEDRDKKTMELNTNKRRLLNVKNRKQQKKKITI